MAADLNVPIEIRICPTIREPDGLAMSSRNAYLSADERRQAACLSRALFMGERMVNAGQRDASEILAAMRDVIHETGVTRLDYLVLVHPETLVDVARIDGPTLAAVAAKVGTTRLIDNHLWTPGPLTRPT
jgi:pantoate--beta-alanine ligase